MASYGHRRCQKPTCSTASKGRHMIPRVCGKALVTCTRRRNRGILLSLHRSRLVSGPDCFSRKTASKCPKIVHSRACDLIGGFRLRHYAIQSSLHRSCRFQAKPWYKPESKGLRRLYERAQVLLGLMEANDIPGAKYKSHGYRLEEMVS